MSKLTKIILGLGVIVILSGIAALLYVEYVVLPREREIRRELEGEFCWECMTPPDEYSEYCQRTGHRWTISLQKAYREGYLSEVWEQDSTGDSVMTHVFAREHGREWLKPEDRQNSIGFSVSKKKAEAEDFKIEKDTNGR